MWDGAKSSTQRSRDLRAKRRELGLRELRVWVTGKDEQIAKEIMKSFERAAFAEAIKERNEVNEESIKYAIEEWHQWLDGRNVPKEKKFSTKKQRLFAYQISRAAQIPLPNDLIFADFHLINDWIKTMLKKYDKRHQVESFIIENENKLD
ncbi:MAG: hypothetical protein Q7V63_07060 [Gammaproteobacteria bacterium]|nr:hypothetical protein [Gammaproteobacteria bacterium]